MVLNLRFSEEEGFCDGVHSQELTGEENIRFFVYNPEPEDAIIGRDLFDAHDYVAALNLGIELAKKGYDKVVALPEKEYDAALPKNKEIIQKTMNFLKDYDPEKGLEL